MDTQTLNMFQRQTLLDLVLREIRSIRQSNLNPHQPLPPHIQRRLDVLSGITDVLRSWD